MSRLPVVSFVSRVLWAAPLLAAASALLGGCPIYSADSCEADPNCASPPPRVDSGTVDTAPPSDGGSDCGSGCSPGYVCTSVATGKYACTAYDCRAAEKACPADQKCLLSDTGVYTCVADAPADCSKTGCITGYTCAPGNAGSRICLTTDPNACISDSDCPAKTGTGSLCLGGSCKAPKDLCTDSTQCKSGSTCLDGRCTPTCSATTTCATGYTCAAKSIDDGKGGTTSISLCTGGGGACDSGKKCTGAGQTCVAGRCLDKAATDGSCKAGLVSIAGGCAIDDRPIFFCDKDGTKDGTQDLCAKSSVCLHHNCYVACTGATDLTTCSTFKEFPVCKSVTTSSGDHFVCGSSTSLGSECDPTATPAKTCNDPKKPACIDGFCK